VETILSLRQFFRYWQDIAEDAMDPDLGRFNRLIHDTGNGLLLETDGLAKEKGFKWLQVNMENKIVNFFLYLGVFTNKRVIKRICMGVIETTRNDMLTKNLEVMLDVNVEKDYSLKRYLFWTRVSQLVVTNESLEKKKNKYLKNLEKRNKLKISLPLNLKSYNEWRDPAEVYYMSRYATNRKYKKYINNFQSLFI
jgi:hypothetical protein